MNTKYDYSIWDKEYCRLVVEEKEMMWQEATRGQTMSQKMGYHGGQVDTAEVLGTIRKRETDV
jgi:hypothetical protein